MKGSDPAGVCERAPRFEATGQRDGVRYKWMVGREEKLLAVQDGGIAAPLVVGSPGTACRDVDGQGLGESRKRGAEVRVPQEAETSLRVEFDDVVQGYVGETAAYPS